MKKCDLSPNDPRHGTENGYNNHRCRCGPCTAAATAYHRDIPGKPCLSCGGPTTYGHRRKYLHKIKRTRFDYCSTDCWLVSMKRRWADAKEAARESKRRQRASRHARGLNSNGKPYTSRDMFLFAAKRYVAPTKRPLWSIAQVLADKVKP